jgi:hypothetical protein
VSALEWALVVAGGWLVLASVVGLVVGRVIRNRDRQIPRSPIPAQRSNPTTATPPPVRMARGKPLL